MRSLLKISHTLKTFYAKLHLLICESDCQNCGLIFKMHMVALFDLIIQLRYGPLWLCWREKHWLYIVWLAPPLRQPAIWFLAVAGWRRGKNRGLRTAGWRVWHSTCIWQKGKYSSISLKVPETERTKTFLCFVAFCGVSVDNLAPKNAGRQVGWKSLIILIVSEALVRIGQPGLDIDWGGNRGRRLPMGRESG